MGPRRNSRKYSPAATGLPAAVRPSHRKLCLPAGIGDRILIGTGEGSLKARNTRRDPRVALSIVDVKDPYTEAQLRGRVVEFRPDRTFALKDVTARKYTGKEFPWRNPEGQVALVIEVDRAKFAKLPFTHAPAGGAR